PPTRFAPPTPAAPILSVENMFPAVPYWEVLDGRVAPGFFKGKVVLVGVTARGLEADYHVTSLTALGYIPGVFIQASAVQTIINSNFIRRWPGRPLATVAMAVLWSCLLGLLFARWRLLSGAAGAFGLAGAIVAAVVYLFNRYGIWVEVAGPLLAPIPLTYVAVLSDRYLHAEREKRRLREQFSRYVSPQAAAEILAHPEGLALAGQKRQVTILFADIRGFTGYAEKAEPTEVVALLNRYLDRMTSAVLANRGCLDKFIGDAVMAVFGAPVPGGDHAREALKAALDMREGIRRLREELASEGRMPLEIGIGIHTGEAVVGNVGSQARTEYTTIGDAVNVAARLEGQAGPGQILVSESTRRSLPAVFAAGLAFEPLGPVAIKGKTLPVEVYALR
ncbi:MAG: CHASE2 domain-containing protein, partial [Firmicutes bacterium]|nr:CHASE2 domain-containing protein [Bacillota bacterium]